MRQYASLVGPLMDLYYPLPFDDEILNRVALNSSRLKSLWCSVYTEDQVNKMVLQYGGTKLPDKFANNLDYNAYEVQMCKNEITTSGNTARSKGDHDEKISDGSSSDDPKKALRLV